MNISLLRVGKIAGLIFIGIILGVIIAGKSNLRITGVNSSANVVRGCGAPPVFTPPAGTYYSCHCATVFGGCSWILQYQQGHLERSTTEQKNKFE